MKRTEKNPSKSKISFIHLILLYALFCIVVSLVVAVMLSRFISKNNTARMNSILSLMSEKVNTSFEMMTGYMTEAADLISAQDEINFEEDYAELQQTLSNMPYFSIGMISQDGTVYGTSGEQMDIERHGFAETAKNIDTIFISEPYRSSVTASNMITMLAPVYQNGEHAGTIFVTYYLETIQNLAYTDVLSEKTAVFLMNPYSGNFVNCSDDANNPPGTWSNVRLIKNEIDCFKGYNYDLWLESMENNDKNNIINFKQDDISYTQAFVSIEGMHNWSLVIRIPVGELSSTMQQYIACIMIGALLLIIATMLLAVAMYKREHSKSEILQTLSDADPLTKAMNRRGFNNTMEEIFADKANLGRCTFIFMDIDFFKDVNDEYGHATGDLILCSVASILKDEFKDIGIVARVGGDEFNIFVQKPLSVEDIDTIMATIRVKMSEIILTDEVSLPISFSAGLAVYPKDAKGLKELIECADKALYHVKENGRKNHFWYSDLKSKK